MMLINRKLGWGGAAIATIALTSVSPFAWADDNELKASLRELAAKIDAMQAEQKRMQTKLEVAEKKAASIASAPAPSPQAVTGGDMPGSFKLPGSNTSISIGGYVKAVGIYTTRNPLAYSPADETFSPATIPLSTTAPTAMRNNSVKLHARESRAILKTSTPSTYGLVTTHLEGDFFGTAGSETVTNSHNFRLRHAWATIGNFAAGQFWSNGANMTAVPENIDQTPTIGVSGAWRQTGFRYTHPVNGGFWSASIENPEAAVVLNAAGTGATTFPDNDRYPDLTAKYHFSAGSGEYEISGIARKMSSSSAAQYSKMGYAASFSGYFKTSGQNRVIFGINTSRDMGRHVGGLAPDFVLYASGLEGVDTNAGFLSYRHYWTPTLRSNLNYSWINLTYPSGYSAATAAGLNKQLTGAHLNLIWAATSQVDLGVEYLRGYRKVQSGLDGGLNRMTFMAKYSF